MKKNEQIDSKKKGKENNNETNIKSSKDEKNLKKIIPLTSDNNNKSKEKSNQNDSEEDKKEKNNEKKNNGKKKHTEIIRVRKRKELIEDKRGVKDLDKSRKKEMKREDSLSNFSVEYSEVIQENGVLKKNDEEINEKIKNSLEKQKLKKQKNGEEDK